LESDPVSVKRTRRTEVASFDAVIRDDGTIVVPAADLRGSRVRVRVTVHELAAALAARGIGEEEVDRVAAVQLEERERAARFLMSEGSLHGGGFARRARRGTGIRR
jgi:hypothetical protein